MPPPWRAHRAPSAVVLVAAGERWDDGSLRVAVEDVLGAGAVADAPAPHRGQQRGGPLAGVRGRGRGMPGGGARPPRRVLHASASGRELSDQGFAADVDIAAELDASRLVPVLGRSGFVAT